MTADLLRRAAALMRERAEAATPGVWREDGPFWWQGGDVNPSCTSMVSAGDDPTKEWVAECGVFTKDAAHIASWHPSVALAVADWLDGSADDWTSYEALAADGMSPTLMDYYPDALAVARAYLGEQT